MARRYLHFDIKVNFPHHLLSPWKAQTQDNLNENSFNILLKLIVKILPKVNNKFMPGKIMEANENYTIGLNIRNCFFLVLFLLDDGHIAEPLET